MPLTVDPIRCPQNHRCPLLSLCPAEAIMQQGFDLPQFDNERCIECGECIRSCGMEAVKKVE